MAEKTMDKIVSLAKARGFVYPGSEIYGGLANTWDYGNLGVELKNNVKKAWWKKFIQESPFNVGVDCAILMNPQTWIASGHLGGFSDPLMDCKQCHERFRADKVIEDYCAENNIELDGAVDAWTQEQMKNLSMRIRFHVRHVESMTYRYPSVQPDVQDIPGSNRGCEEYGISPSGDCTGYLRKLQECTAYLQKETAIWYRTDR